MSWTAVIPFKGRAERKTRLAGCLTLRERTLVSQRWLTHVADRVAQSGLFHRVLLLSDLRPPGWSQDFVTDGGRGLNAELSAIAGDVRRRLLVIHADLPLLRVADLVDLVTGAETAGCGLAPDRHGTGTNALALASCANFEFAFGNNSFARHLCAAGTPVQVVRRRGLALDIDTAADLGAARACGYRFMEHSAGRPAYAGESHECEV